MADFAFGVAVGTIAAASPFLVYPFLRLKTLILTAPEIRRDTARLQQKTPHHESRLACLKGPFSLFQRLGFRHLMTHCFSVTVTRICRQLAIGTGGVAVAAIFRVLGLERYCSVPVLYPILFFASRPFEVVALRLEADVPRNLLLADSPVAASTTSVPNPFAEAPAPVPVERENSLLAAEKAAQRSGVYKYHGPLAFLTAARTAIAEGGGPLALWSGGLLEILSARAEMIATAVAAMGLRPLVGLEIRALRSLGVGDEAWPMAFVCNVLGVSMTALIAGYLALPLETVQRRMAVACERYENPLQAIWHIANTEGLCGFYPSGAWIIPLASQLGDLLRSVIFLLFPELTDRIAAVTPVVITTPTTTTVVNADRQGGVQATHVTSPPHATATTKKAPK